MKDKIIKKVLNEKKTITSIFLIVPAICLLTIATFFIIMMFDKTFGQNIREVTEVFTIFGGIGVFGLALTFYLMKFTNKLNAIKIPKDELEKLYDEHIDDKIIGNVENTCEQVKSDYEDIKKNGLYRTIITIIIIAITGSIIFIEGINAFVGYLVGIICIVSIFNLISTLEIVLKSTDKLVEEFRENQILEIFSSKISNRNKEIIKEKKKAKTKRKNPVLFWGIEIILLLWCLAAFNGDVLSLVEEEGIYGIIALVIIFGLPAFFFVRNIYTRYVKQTK